MSNMRFLQLAAVPLPPLLQDLQLISRTCALKNLMKDSLNLAGGGREGWLPVTVGGGGAGAPEIRGSPSPALGLASLNLGHIYSHCIFKFTITQRNNDSTLKCF